MSGWRYIAERLNGDGTGTFLDHNVPLTGVGIDLALSSPDTLSATIQPELQRMKGPDGLPLFEPWSTALYAEKDGDIRFGGILGDDSFSKSQWEMTFIGFIGYWNEMPYTGAGEFFVKKDTLDITRSIISHVQSQPGSNLGLIPGGGLSGRKVGSTLASEEYDPEGGPGGLELESQAYKLAWYQNHDLLGDIHKLAELSPFDYRESHAWDSSHTNIVHRLHFGAPTLGRRLTDARFAIGENVMVTPQVRREGAAYASEVYLLGAGEGAKMVRGRGLAERKGRLRRVTILSDPSVRHVGSASAAAGAEVRWRSRMENVESIVVRDTELAPIGSVHPGDEIYLTGQAGWAEIDDWYRVLNVRIVPDAPGAAELTVRRADRMA